MNKIPMRDGYGKALLKLIGNGKPVVALDADVAKSTRTVWVRDQYPEHFLDMGIAEQDMVGTASGLALGGIIPFASTYGVFLAGRAWDQIRTTVCYNNLNVKLAGAHAGISVGPDGATHQALEDVALMRVLPNMTVVVPCDAVETEKATLALAVPVITDEDSPFEIGKANVLRDGKDAVLFANGAMVYEGLEAAKRLSGEGIDLMVVNLHTVKPLDQEAVLTAARKTGRVITAEEHQAAGGMGSAVAECLAQHYPVPMRILGMQDGFGESGAPDELMKRYGFSSDAIYQAVKDFVAL